MSVLPCHRMTKEWSMSLVDTQQPGLQHFPSKARRLLLDSHEAAPAMSSVLLVPLAGHRRTASSVSKLHIGEDAGDWMESAKSIPEPPKTAGEVPWGGVTLFPPFTSYLDFDELPCSSPTSATKQALKKSLSSKRSYHNLLSNIVKNRRKPSEGPIDSIPNTPTTPKAHKIEDTISFVRKLSGRITGGDRPLPDSAAARRNISSPKPIVPPKEVSASPMSSSSEDSLAPRTPDKPRTKTRPAPLKLMSPSSVTTTLSYDVTRRPRHTDMLSPGRNLDSPPIYSFGDAYEVPRSPYGHRPCTQSPVDVYDKAQQQLKHLQSLSASDDDIDVVLPSVQVLEEHGVQVPGDDESELHFRHKKHTSNSTARCSVSHDLEDAYNALNEVSNPTSDFGREHTTDRQSVVDRLSQARGCMVNASGTGIPLGGQYGGLTPHPPLNIHRSRPPADLSMLDVEACHTPKAYGRPTPLPNLPTRSPLTPTSDPFLSPKACHSTPSTPRKPLTPITSTPTLAERIEAATPTPALDTTFCTATEFSTSSYKSCWSDTDDESFDLLCSSLEHMQSGERVSVVERIARPSAPAPLTPTLRTIRSASDLRANIGQGQSRYASAQKPSSHLLADSPPAARSTSSRRQILQSAKSFDWSKTMSCDPSRPTLQQRRERRGVRIPDGLLTIETHSNASLLTASSSEGSSCLSSDSAMTSDTGIEARAVTVKEAVDRTASTLERGYDKPPLTSRFSFESVSDNANQPAWYPTRSKTPLRELLKSVKVTSHHF